ncbi:TonB-dependent receptor [Gammaproteobacteria bacterium]|nr:TonB-dependent receptor [Gammaproteobacteria bacterium]MDB2582951.1 TonB-dependent receptor [Gammaproteobacteria bacterium]MDB9747402.1 TonB-dependent receptor [Gammaproteobacteria bacterium]
MSYIKLLKNTLLLNLVFISVAASAQEIEEVVVTATKKSESIQDLALSIEALSAEALDVNQIYDVSDLADVTPGLETAKGIGSGSAWTIRGMGSFGIGAGVIASVVTAVNGHSVNDSVVADIGFFDLERVEVLKGPQGTLFGRNAANGVINFITARPSNEYGGEFNVDIANFDSKKTTAVLNLPISDALRTRFAVMSNERGGMVTNRITGNVFDDRSDLAFRLSVDYDLSDRTQVLFTYSDQKSDDNRFQEEVTYCAQDQFFGCDPYQRGGMNVPLDTRGGFAGAFGFLAHLYPGTIQNGFDSSVASTDFTEVSLNREPTHFQKQTVANLQINHDLTENLLLTAKLSYETRDFHQSGDQDLGYSTNPFLGAGAGIGLAPVTGNLCFGGERQFCENVTTERVYDFSDVATNGMQVEVNLVSDFEGPINYTVGLYQIENRNDNTYTVQTAGSQFMTSFAVHPYSQVVKSLTGNDWSGKAGIGFYQDALSWLATVPNALSCLGGGPCDLAGLGAYGAATAKQNAYPDFVIPWELGGIINDQNVNSTSQALYGELYVDLSDETKLTLGARYQDDKVTSYTYNDTGAQAWMASGGWLVDNRDSLPFVDITSKADDGFQYKLALQHDISDDVMVYGSYTTAVKAGGVNAGDNPTTYEPENAGVLDFGLKSILLDGAMLLNMNVFNAKNKDFLVAAVIDTGTQNRNIDAEFTGFEGNMMVFLSETTKLEMNWLFLEHEVTSDTFLIDYLNPAGAPAAGPTQSLANGFVTAQGFTNGAFLFKSAGFNCTVPFSFATGCPAGVAQGVEQSIKGNNLPGSSDKSYGMSLTQDFISSNGMTSARLSYRYTGSADLSIFNMERLKIDARDSWDLLVRYSPNTEDWYTGLFIKNIRDQQHINALRESSNVGGGALLGSFTDPRTYGVEFGVKF